MVGLLKRMLVLIVVAMFMMKMASCLKGQKVRLILIGDFYLLLAETRNLVLAHQETAVQAGQQRDLNDKYMV